MSSCTLVSNVPRVFPDVEERLAKYKSDNSSFLTFRAFDHELLTSNERKHFNYDKPPVWIDMITLELLQNGDMYGRKYPGITKFEFYKLSPSNCDAMFRTHTSNIEDNLTSEWNSLIMVSHDNISGKFAVFGHFNQSTLKNV